jgi:hypothetical protein
MSTVKLWSLENALTERPHPSEKPIISRNVLESAEDFILTCLNESRLVDRGYVQMKLDREMCDKSLSKRRDFNKKQVTEFAQKIQKAQLAPGLLGCQRESMGRTKVGQVLGKSDFSIGDVSLTKFVRRKGLVDFFDLVKTESILSKEALGQDIGGFTHPTIQLSGGPCVLPFHIEHWAAASVNVLHWGQPKVWEIIPPDQFLPAVLNMKNLQESVDLGNYGGVCESTLTHRDVFYDTAILSVQSHRVVQKPGDIMVIAPFAMHSVQNLGTNCSASQNFMPPELLPQCAAYKTCFHSEGLGGKPLFNTMTAMIEDLYRSGKIELQDYIHDSDPLKSYKLKVVDKARKDGNKSVLKEVLQHIKISATTPAWFEFILPMEGKAQTEDESSSKSVEDKYFLCSNCDYSTNHHSDLGKHIRRKHGDEVNVPPNTNQVKCPECGKVLKCLRKHKDLQRCKKRPRED